MKGKVKFFDKSLLTIHDEKGKLTLFGLAIPLFFESIGTHIIGVVQTMMSSNFMDGFFVSATSIANAVLTPFISLISIVCVGMAIILSINIGRKKLEDCKSIAGTAIIANAVLVILFNLIILIFAKELLAFMGYTGEEYAEKLPYAIKYMRLRVIPNIIGYCASVFHSILRCYGHTKVGIYTVVVANCVNALLSALFFFVMNPLKENVIIGLIAIQIIANSINFILTLIVLLKKKIPVKLEVNFGWLKTILKLGVPASIASIAYNVSSLINTKICVSLGENYYDAVIFINQIVYFVYIFGLQLGTANSLMLGRLCGMQQLERADKMHRQNYFIVVGINVCLSLIVALFGSLILKYAYSASTAVIAIAMPIFWIDVLVEIGRGMNHMGQFGLNATGDVLFTTCVSTISAFACSVGLAYLFGIVFNLGLVGIWFAFIIDEGFRGVLYLCRWIKGRWKNSFKHELEELQKEEIHQHEQVKSV